MRQTTLLEFGLHVLTIYVPRRNYPYKSRRGLAESQLKKRLEKQGWMVWRGGFFHAINGDLYPVVRRKYVQLVQLIKELYNANLYDYLCYLDTVHHGMPDYIAYHPQLQKLKFVECKLGHEQLSVRQIQTIHCLQDKGFNVEVHKLVDPCTKTRKAKVNLLTKNKHVLEQVKPLTKYIRTSRVKSKALCTSHKQPSGS